jgi:hypothetical protein
VQGFIQFGDWTAFVDSIRRAAIDFVVISDVLPIPDRYGFSFPAGRNEYPFGRRLVKEYGTRVIQYEHMQVYRLRPIPSAPVRALQH